MQVHRKYDLYFTSNITHEHIKIDKDFMNTRDLRPRKEWLNKHTSLCFHKNHATFEKKCL